MKNLEIYNLYSYVKLNYIHKKLWRSVMDNKNIIASLVLGALLAIGLAVGGYNISQGLIESKTTGRFVSVKGLSEKIFQADFANWGMNLRAVGPDLQSTMDKLEGDRSKLVAFLVKHGFKEDEIENDRFRVEDAFTQLQYGSISAEQVKPTRYKISQVIVVRSADVEKVHNAYKEISDLLKEGVMVDSENQYYSNGPQYELTGFNNIKGEMLNEAIVNARKAAEAFAVDSKSKLGKIKYANQGVFTINSLESNPSSEPGSINKKVRLVVTQEYYLKD